MKPLSICVALALLATTASAEEHDSLMRYRTSALSLEWSFFGGMAERGGLAWAFEHLPYDPVSGDAPTAIGAEVVVVVPRLPRGAT